MINELLKTLSEQLRTIADLIIEESVHKKTAKEVEGSIDKDLLIAAYTAVDKVLSHYLANL